MARHSLGHASPRVPALHVLEFRYVLDVSVWLRAAPIALFSGKKAISASACRRDCYDDRHKEMELDHGPRVQGRARGGLMMDADLVLIHGLGSSPATWGRLIPLLEADDDLRGLRIHPFGYESPTSPLPRLPGTRIPDYVDIADFLRLFLQLKTEQTNTAIVTHSQGGLIVQRYLAWMLRNGHGHELAAIKLIVMIACPNEGSEFLRTPRKVTRFDQRPQVRELGVLNADVAEARHLVWTLVDRATGVSDDECPIPIYAYSGMSDGIVSRTSAQSYFRNIGSLPGTHLTVLDPNAPYNETFPVLKLHLLDELHRVDQRFDNSPTRADHDRGPLSGSATVPGQPQAQQSGGTGNLERVTPLFTGRDDQIAEIETAVAAAQQPQDIREVFVIHGMPGIGKTTLAVHLAHRLVTSLHSRVEQAGLKMDVRQLDMYGFGDRTPQDPADILRKYLSAASGDSQKITTDLDGLKDQWRLHMIGKFLVLVLDNVGDEDQVLPFLPGGAGHIVLVTSRRPLLGLRIKQGAKLVGLPVLPPQEAVHLIEAVSGRTIEADDQEAAEGIAALLDYHPQAITITAAGLAGRPYITFAVRLAELKAAPNSLLAVDEYADKDSGRVARSFELSYRQLTKESQFVLRRLGLAPVPYISAEVAAALTGLSPAAAGIHLNGLHSEALIEQGPRGYRLHDLIRHYAAGLASKENTAGNTRAVDRVLHYYYAAATYVDSLLTRQPPPPVFELPPPTVNHQFADRDRAIAWARDELENLQACADYAASSTDGSQRKAWIIRFSSALAGVLRNESQWARSIELQSRAITAARELAEPLAEANALHERALLYRLSGGLEEAETDLVRALEIYRSIGGDAGGTGEAHALNTYSVVLDQTDRPVKALDGLAASLAGYRRLGNRLGEANVLLDQGMTAVFANRFPGAVDLIGQALTLFQAVDHPLGQAHAHLNLAKAQRHVGLERKATENLEAAQKFYRQLHNQLGEASALTERGAVLWQQEEYDWAEGVLRQAVELHEEIGNKLALALALEKLAGFYIERGDLEYAKILLLRALELYRRHEIRRDIAGLLEKLRSLGFLDEEDDSGR
jgi:tetratricopeptide (TPR) repeat protein/pimeloyl-ACP methyl ester carboxylesterase